MLCARYLLSDGCGEWINLDAIHKMAIIRMDGKFGKPGEGLTDGSSQGDSACPAIWNLASGLDKIFPGEAARDCVAALVFANTED
jgi:hypothetical protein